MTAAANQAESEDIIETALAGAAAATGNLIINNQASGNASLIFQVISEKFRLE